jgi:hypothetical protein
MVLPKVGLQKSEDMVLPLKIIVCRQALSKVGP